MSDAVKKEIEESLETIRSGLLSLNPTGCDGFEGLLRIVLSSLTGIPFRLAKGGSQGGRDGDPALENDLVYFEAKRYSGDIPKHEVLSKILEFSSQSDAADRLRVLGSTAGIGAQLKKIIEKAGDECNLSIIFLDWATPFPFLAITVVAAGDEASNFILDSFDEKEKKKRVSAEKLKDTFSTIAEHPEFEIVL